MNKNELRQQINAVLQEAYDTLRNFFNDLNEIMKGGEQ